MFICVVNMNKNETQTNKYNINVFFFLPVCFALFRYIFISFLNKKKRWGGGCKLYSKYPPWICQCRVIVDTWVIFLYNPYTKRRNLPVWRFNYQFLKFFNFISNFAKWKMPSIWSKIWWSKQADWNAVYDMLIIP